MPLILHRVVEVMEIKNQVISVEGFEGHIKGVITLEPVKVIVVEDGLVKDFIKKVRITYTAIEFTKFLNEEPFFHSLPLASLPSLLQACAYEE